MEKQNHKHLVTLSIIVALGVVSFALCIASEFKKTKRKHIKLQGRFCSLPASNAFGLGIAALVCLFVAHIIGNFIVSKDFRLGGKRRCNDKNAIVPIIFLFLSWISFSMAVVMLVTSTSMNDEQSYGKGWLDGDCYVVKDGIFFGSGILILVAIGLTISLIIMKKSSSQIEQYVKAPAEQS